jgi:hypothetical protein
MLPNGRPEAGGVRAEDFARSLNLKGTTQISEDAEAVLSLLNFSKDKSVQM